MGNCLFCQYLWSPSRKVRESQNITLRIWGRKMVAVAPVCSHTEEEDAPPEFRLEQETSYVT